MPVTVTARVTVTVTVAARAQAASHGHGHGVPVGHFQLGWQPHLQTGAVKQLESVQYCERCAIIEIFCPGVKYVKYVKYSGKI